MNLFFLHPQKEGFSFVGLQDGILQFKTAGVAQLVERQPSKLNVAGSNPVSRSEKKFSQSCSACKAEILNFRNFEHDILPT